MNRLIYVDLGDIESGIGIIKLRLMELHESDKPIWVEYNTYGIYSVIYDIEVEKEIFNIISEKEVKQYSTQLYRDDWNVQCGLEHEDGTILDFTNFETDIKYLIREYIKHNPQCPTIDKTILSSNSEDPYKDILDLFAGKALYPYCIEKRNTIQKKLDDALKINVTNPIFNKLKKDSVDKKQKENILKVEMLDKYINFLKEKDFKGFVTTIVTGL